MGVVHIAPDAKWNEARIYSPSSPVRVYEKHHMLPPFESPLKPGTTRTLWKEPSGIWGVTICKDMDFPAMGRDYANDGAGLLLVPAWDFVGDGWLHGRMAILRGVESGFSIARAPKQGILTATDNRGRVLAERITGLQPFVSLVANVPVQNDRTIYAQSGDWFAWLNVGLFPRSDWWWPAGPHANDIEIVKYGRMSCISLTSPPRTCRSQTTATPVRRTDTCYCNFAYSALACL